MYGFIIATNVIVLSITYYQIFENDKYYTLLLLLVIWYFSVKGWVQTRRLKTISYDDSAVYYEKDGYEVQIPFEDIKNIELDQGWSINLYRPAQDGDKILFMPSVFYPFNFRKREVEINKLRDKIDDYKRMLGSQYSEQLPSRNIDE